ncbi:MAG: transposase, partial [Elusimicrobiales bacterium]|nr:transposase [Elusimicrobiales bacterium]
MLTNSDNIEKIDYRQGAFSRTPSSTELIERLAHRQLRAKVKSAIQSGTISYIVSQEINAMISEALNARLAAERDAILGSQPYERGGATKRNGYKLKSLPGLWGRLTLRRPVVRAGSLSLPLLEAL